MAKSVSSLTVLKDDQLLTGSDNYQAWSFLMEGILFNDGLWKIVCTGVTAVAAADRLVEEETSKRAMYKIVFNCNAQLHPILIQMKHGKEVWDKLKELYGKSTNSSMIGLLQKLFQAKLEYYDNVDSYLTDIMSNQSKLSQMGHGLNDVHLAHLMLIGLPIQYQPLRMTLESLNQELTSDYVRQKIKNFQLDKCQAESAMFSRNAKAGEQRERRSGSGNQSGACFYCDEPGHIKRYCKKWKAERQKQKSQDGHFSKHKNDKRTSKEKANLVVNSSSDEDRCLLSVAGTDAESALHVSGVTPWYVDSGATKHMCSEQSLYNSFNDSSQKITVANGHTTPAKGVGDVKLNLDVGATVLKNVLLVPGLSSNLISVAAMVDRGLTVTFKTQGCLVTDAQGTPLMTARRDGGLFQVNLKETGPEDECCKLQALAVKVSTSNQDLWHRRFGHLSIRQMKLIHTKNCSVGSLQDRDCEVCIRGKMVRKPFPPSKTERSTEPLQLIHTDLFGPVKLASFGGARYVLLLQDDFSRKIFAYFLKSKSEVHVKFCEFKKMVENQQNRTIKTVRSDNGTEFINQYLGQALKQAGIIHQTSAPYSPQQNGVAERGNRTIIDMATCMLLDSKRNFRFWAEATACAVYVRNRTPCSVLDGGLPEEVWAGKSISLNHLKIFGTSAMVLIPKEKRRKFEEKASKMIFVGYSETAKAYKFVDIRNPAGKYTISRDARFLEDSDPEEVLAESPEQSSHPFLDSADYFVETEEAPEIPETPVIEEVVHQEEPRPKRNRTLKRDPDFEYNLLCHCSECLNDLPNPMHFAFHTSSQALPDEPKTVEEAMSRNDADQWKQAMKDEMQAHLDNGTWTAKEAPPGKRIISTRWVFKLKRSAGGTMEVHKARLVARGFNQVPGEDFNETSSPTIRHSSVRLLFALAVKRDWEIDHVDVKTAFLQGDLNEDIYIKLPTGEVCKLHKALYGLKQASRAWYLTLTNAVKDMKLKKMTKEPCIFYRVHKKDIVIIAVYVDDILIFSHSPRATAEIKSELAARFQCRDLGPISSYLGVRVTRDREKGVLKLDQQAYLMGVLDEAGMQTCNPCSIPLSTSSKLTKPTQEETDDWANCSMDRRSFTGYTILLGGGAIAWESRKQKCVALSSTEAEYVALAELVKEVAFLKSIMSELCLEPDNIDLWCDNAAAVAFSKQERTCGRLKHIEIRYFYLRELLQGQEYQLRHIPTTDQVADVLTKPLTARKHRNCIAKMGVSH